MSNTPLSPPMQGELFDHQRTARGVSWQHGAPLFRMEPAVVETVVTHTTRTITSFPPLQLPRITPPETLISPSHLASEVYPLARAPVPDDMRSFTMKLGDHRVVIQDPASPRAESSRAAAARGWHRTEPAISDGYAGPAERISLLQGIERCDKGKEARKRPHRTPLERDRTPKPSPPGSASVAGMTMTDNPTPMYSPPRKRIRVPDDVSMTADSTSAGPLLSPLPSPEQQTPPLISPAAATGAGPGLSLGTGHEIAALYSLPSIISHFDGLPDKLQQHVLMQLLRRSRMPTVQRVTAFASAALRRDFISDLPHELAVQVLQSIDAKTLTRATRVSKKWQRMIDTERGVWKQRLIDDDLYQGHGVEEEEEALIKKRFEILDERAQLRPPHSGTPDDEYYDSGDEDEFMGEPGPSRPSRHQHPASRATTANASADVERPVPLKHVYRRRHMSNRNWFEKRPMHNSFPGQGTNVVTCLQFDRDKIVSASDDHSINVYVTKTGELLKRLDGHEGGVWALQYLGDTLVSGSTDRTLRVWDLETLEPLQVFHGHQSTVRCLQIVEPVLDPASGEYLPPYPVVITGSRDFQLRVWKLPKRGEPRIKTQLGWNDQGQPVELPLEPVDNPYHIHCLIGHRQAIRAIAAYGRYCVSGSYDHTVRVWDIVKGKCLHVLTGHDQKVYSIVYDRHRHRCASGSMDNTVKVWDLETGTCLHTLTGHTSLVGLLGMSPNYLVSAAADSSLRIWNSADAQLKQVLANNGGAITCFQHDEHKVVSGSDGMLKLWDIRKGAFVRDLVIGISSVWQVAFNGNLLVAASNRAGSTVYDVFDFGELDHQSGVDDDRLDSMRPPAWERDNPREPRMYQLDERDREYGRSRKQAARQWQWTVNPMDLHKTAGSTPKRGKAGRRSARIAAQPREIESSTSPTPVAGPSNTNTAGSSNRASRLRQFAHFHHHHHHHHPRVSGGSDSPSYQGRITRSRSGPGLANQASPLRVNSARTGSTGQLRGLALGDQRSYAPVFDDEEHTTPRFRPRDLLESASVSEEDDEEAEDQMGGSSGVILEEGQSDDEMDDIDD